MQIIKRFSAQVEEQKVRVSLVVINSDDARELLQSNTDNRKIKRAKVAEYKRAIERGDFWFNGDAIRISDKGVMLDGQHRLEALASTNGTITVLLVEGLPAEARDTIDVGATRTAANLLEFGGGETGRVANAVNIAALGRAALILEDESMPSKLEVAQFVHRNRDELESAYRHGAHTVESSPLKGGTTPYALAAYLIGKVEQDQTVIGEFFARLASGEGLYHGDPILTLRNRLISSPPDTSGGSRHRYLKNSALFIRAWNAWAAGKELNYLRAWGEGQRFPDPIRVSDKLRAEVYAELADADADADDNHAALA